MAWKKYINRIIFISLILFIAVNVSLADEIITGFESQDIPVLNEELRKLKRSISAITTPDEKAKVSSNDTTAGYLNGKLTAGSGITLTEGTDGGDETLSISLSGTTYANKQLYTSNGTFTAPAGVTLIYVSLIGAGGGGASSTDGPNAGGGGGAGAYIHRRPYAVTPGASYSIVVGSGGAGGTDGDNYNAPGAVGGDSSFDTVIVAKGGSGGNATEGGAGGLAQAAVAGDASTSTGGVISKVAGVAGGAGGARNSTTGGGGGGSMAGAGPNGTTGTGVTSSNYGTGGTGGGNSGGAHAGGAGKSGFVLIEW